MLDELLPPALAQSASDQPQEQIAQVSHHLEPLLIKRKRFAYADKTLYRVYHSATEFKLVDAESAVEAFEKSGIAKPHKIQREAYYHYVALKQGMIEHTDDVIEVDVELPSLEERKILLDAAMLAEEPDAHAVPFESVLLADLFIKMVPEPEPVEPVIEEPVIVKSPPPPEPPSFFAPPDPSLPAVVSDVSEAEGESSLSKDEILALLGDEEKD